MVKLTLQHCGLENGDDDMTTPVGETREQEEEAALLKILKRIDGEPDELGVCPVCGRRECPVQHPSADIGGVGERPHDGGSESEAAAHMWMWSERNLEEAAVPQWREHGRVLIDVLARQAATRGLRPTTAPELPLTVLVPMAEVIGPYRVMCHYVVMNVIGYEPRVGEAGFVASPEPHEIPIYGPPGFRVRVDTICEIAGSCGHAL